MRNYKQKITTMLNFGIGATGARKAPRTKRQAAVLSASKKKAVVKKATVAAKAAVTSAKTAVKAAKKAVTAAKRVNKRAASYGKSWQGFCTQAGADLKNWGYGRGTKSKASAAGRKLKKCRDAS